MKRDLRYIESLIEDIEYLSHPNDKELADFIDNKLTGDSKEKIIEHLVHCYQCREVINEVIEYKKKPKFVNNLITVTPLVALVASLLVFIYLPQDINIEIGMIDLSKSSVEYRAEDSQKENKIIDGDKFLEEIKESTKINYLKEFNQAENEKDFITSLSLYQEAINSVSENISEEERLRQIIIIRSYILKRAIEEGNKIVIKNYKDLIRDNIRTYYFDYKKEKK